MEYEICAEDRIRILGPFRGVDNLMSGSAREIRVRFGEEGAVKQAVAGGI